MKVVFSSAAKASLRQIALFIARDNKVHAVRFVRELEAKAKDIGKMPRAFPILPRYEISGIRRRPCGNYLILYRIDENQVSIIHILHAAQDIDVLLSPDT